MKPVIIIAIAVVCSVAVFFGLSVLDIDDMVKTKVNSFDCAEAFDKLMTISNNQNQGDPRKLTQQSIDMMDNRCFITVKSWAHESMYESDLWNSPWEHTSWVNQLYLGEIPCNDVQCQAVIDNVWNAKKLL